MKTLKIRDGTQVNLDGRVYGGGKQVQVDEAMAARLVARGFASEVEAKKVRKNT